MLRLQICFLRLILFSQNGNYEDNDPPAYPDIRDIEGWKPAYMKIVGDATPREAIGDIRECAAKKETPAHYREISGGFFAKYRLEYAPDEKERDGNCRNQYKNGDSYTEADAAITDQCFRQKNECRKLARNKKNKAWDTDMPSLASDNHRAIC